MRAPLCPQAGYFKDDPRRTARQWRELLSPLVGDLSLEADVSQVAEVGWGRAARRASLNSG